MADIEKQINEIIKILNIHDAIFKELIATVKKLQNDVERLSKENSILRHRN
jgi:hypothetical protein